MPVTLILGGARSGKSARAQQLAEASGLDVCYVATASHIEDDAEWQARIECHRQSRPGHWQTIECERDLVALLKDEAGEGCLILVDCLTLWLSNLLMHEADMEKEVAALAELLLQLPGDTVLVSNEVGLGLVPESPLGRAFRDAQGRLNQAVAKVADNVEFVAAGIPLLMKGERS